jgi:hypothetical protein
MTCLIYQIFAMQLHASFAELKQHIDALSSDDKTLLVLRAVEQSSQAAEAHATLSAHLREAQGIAHALLTSRKVLYIKENAWTGWG